MKPEWRMTLLIRILVVAGCLGVALSLVLAALPLLGVT